jgi:hypothetical protein
MCLVMPRYSECAWSCLDIVAFRKFSLEFSKPCILCCGCNLKSTQPTVTMFVSVACTMFHPEHVDVFVNLLQKFFVPNPGFSLVTGIRRIPTDSFRTPAMLGLHSLKNIHLQKFRTFDVRYCTQFLDNHLRWCPHHINISRQPFWFYR